jgi:hypothetical protein
VYNGSTPIPIVKKQHNAKNADVNKDKKVIKATPFVPTLYPKNPEQMLLNKGKNTIKLNIKILLIIDNFF